MNTFIKLLLPSKKYKRLKDSLPFDENTISQESIIDSLEPPIHKKFYTRNNVTNQIVSIASEWNK